MLNSSLIGFNIPSSGSITIHYDEHSMFIALLFAQGALGAAYALYMLNGYGVGSDSRYHATNLIGTDAISITISNTDFVIANQNSTILYCELMIITGPSPDIS